MPSVYSSWEISTQGWVQVTAPGLLVLGIFLTGGVNENKQLLLELCFHRHLCSSNTLFSIKPQHKSPSDTPNPNTGTNLTSFPPNTSICHVSKSLTATMALIASQSTACDQLQAGQPFPIRVAGRPHINISNIHTQQQLNE